jgi:hypothetical protein
MTQRAVSVSSIIAILLEDFNPNAGGRMNFGSKTFHQRTRGDVNVCTRDD